MKYPSLSLVLTGCIIGYVLYSVYTISLLFLPPNCSKEQRCLKTYLSNAPQLQIHLFSSMKASPGSRGETLKLLTDNLNYQYENDRPLQLEIPWRTRQNGSLYLHVFVSPYSMQEMSWDDVLRDKRSVYCRIPMTQYHVPQTAAFNLLKDKDAKKFSELQTVSHLKTKVALSMLTDNITLPQRNIPPELERYLKVTPNQQFLPIIVHNFLETKLDDLILMKNSNETVQLKFVPISIGKLRLILHLEAALLSLRKMGFSSKDVDDLKNIFAGTNFYILTLTITFASFHLLFDFLAFKNDVSFWRRKSNLEGLSTTTVLWRAFSQCVVFLYLLDENSSILVLGPCGIAVLIELWKVVKIFRRRKSIQHSAGEKETDALDAESMKYLSYLLYPLCLGGAVYSLLYQPHRSWYSWSINSLANGVYAFGFLFMLPQLFINYRLKSVAALPWKAFMYKAFNTFIDDVFAFIITMPTAHRVACFRDDIVFLIYLYQRWLYPVDKSRMDEATRAIGGDDQEESKKDK